MPKVELKNPGQLLYALIAVLALMQAGCLLAVIGGAAGGAAATGYFYCKGRLYRDYPASLPDVHNAVHAALSDLHFGIFTDETKDGKAFLLTRTATGQKIRIYLECLSSPIPADGLITRVAIRVATFGDEGISARIFEQVAFRLSHPAPITPAPPGAPPIGAPVPVPVQQTGFQTTEPKMAPPK
jgi:hypothetical protein